MPERVQRRRIKGQPGIPAGALYVGRPTVFGNPWKVIRTPNPTGVGDDWTVEGPGGFFFFTDELDHAHDFAVQLYREWLDMGEQCAALKCRRDDETQEQRRELEHRRHRILGQLHTLNGHDLACWCTHGLACHADLLLELANQELTSGT